MELAIDSVLLEKMAQAGMLEKMGELFGEPRWIVAPSVLKAAKKNWEKYIRTPQLLSSRSIATKKLGKRERRLIAKKRRKWFMLSKQELEAISIARAGGLIYLTNEDLARELCRELDVRYMTLPMLLKALWAKKIATKKEVAEFMERLEGGQPVRLQRKELILGEA